MPKKKSSTNPNEIDEISNGFVFTKNQQKFLDALRQSKGIISKAAHLSNLHRCNHHDWMRDSENYKKEYEAILDECIDFVEDALLSNIDNGDTTSIIFYLKTKAKKRGYVERVENEVTISTPTIIDWSENNIANAKTKGGSPDTKE